MDNKAKPASQEAVDNLIKDMLLTQESSFREFFADLRLKEVLKRDDLHGLDAAVKEFVEKVLRIHANLCYANLCLCVQMRASLKAKIGVEKQFNIRRSVGTLHELYKYLYGFTDKKTLWQEIETEINGKYPMECQTIDDAAQAFLQKYAQEADGTLRDVTKHYSNDPTEFFRNMENVNERSVTERFGAAIGFLRPLHFMLTKELKEHLGILYDTAIDYPMPNQNVDISGVNIEKIEAMGPALLKYGGIVNHLMKQLNSVEALSQKLNMDVTQNPHWKDLSENNVGLHILYIYIDMMVTFRAFIGSESFAETRQNLAYLIVSAHEGFKKLYGFDASKRDTTFWNRAIKTAILKNGDEKAMQEMEAIEKRLDVIANNPLLQDEDTVVAFSHIGTIKKRNDESSFLVLDYFRQPISKDDMNGLTDFLYVMNDIVLLYNQVMDLENKQMQKETDDMFAGYYDKINAFEQQVKEKTQDPKVLAQCEELTDKMREFLKKVNDMFS